MKSRRRLLLHVVVVLQGFALGTATACYSPSKPIADEGGAQCPTDDDDSGCQVCAKQNCCAEVAACQDDADCDCLSDCVAEMGIEQSDFCTNSCDVDEIPAEYDALVECAIAADCDAVC